MPTWQQRLGTNWVRLREPTDEDARWLFEQFSDPINHFFMGTLHPCIPSLEDFEMSWRGAGNQVIVEDIKTGARIGHFHTGQVNLSNGYTFFGGYIERRFQRWFYALDAAYQFCDLVFARHRVRKLYTMVNAVNERSLGIQQRVSLFRLEGQLIEHQWTGGRFWDTYWFSISREDWEAMKDDRLRALQPRTVQ